MSCTDRVVIVTGAGIGIGRAHALALGKAGARVVVNDLGTSGAGVGNSPTPAESVVSEIQAAGGEAIPSFADITDWEQAGTLVQETLMRLGRLDAVVNNAGILRDRMFVSSTVDEWDAVMRVHLRGHYCVSRHAAAHWRTQAKAGRMPDARIINTSSGAGLQGSVGQAAYATAKGGIASLTLVQAAELGRYGITANAIAPAARTRMTEDLFADTMKIPESGFDPWSPENISPLVVWLCSTESHEVTGQMFEIQGGTLKLSDGWRPGPTVEKNERWTPEEIGKAVAELVGQADPPAPVYGGG
jgi:NAD(P)-dependent dehydrogenase (short-subunit alcohol dehydrogenase family)